MSTTTADQLQGDLGLSGQSYGSGGTLYADASSVLHAGIMSDAARRNGTATQVETEIQSDSTVANHFVNDPLGAYLMDNYPTLIGLPPNYENEMDKANNNFSNVKNRATEYLSDWNVNLTKYQSTYLDQRIQNATKMSQELSDENVMDLVVKAGSLPPLGSLSKQFEVGAHGGPWTVSTGAGDKGGVSYGSYQMSSVFKIPQNFLANEGSAWASNFVNMDPTVHGGDFGKTWKAIGLQDTDNFHDAQHSYIERTDYTPVLQAAISHGFDTSDIGVQNALWSQSVQQSPNGNAQILSNASKAAPPNTLTPEQQINAIYDARTAYASKYASSAATTDRYNQERREAIRLSNQFK
jgi:hypothetical protein